MSGPQPALPESASLFAVIFDMDGVLVDSEPLTLRAYRQAAAEFGVQLDGEAYIRQVITEGRLIQDFFVSWGGRPEDWEGLFRRKTEVYRELAARELKLKPGALELLKELKAQRIPCALATSAARVSMELNFAAQRLAEYFPVTVTFEDVVRKKPDPEVFLKAAEKLNLSPNRCIVIEDALKGLLAAKAAGMICVAVLTPFSRAEDLLVADLVVASLEELTSARLAAMF
jgi:HAD superfamily hydrolase (TIGR01509 family)